LDGRQVAIKFMSPLAKAQDGEDILSVQQAISFVINTAGPDQVGIGFKVEDFAAWVGDKTGMPAELVRSEAEKMEIMQAGVAAQAQGAEGNEPPPPQGQTTL
jgi:hypothetical protein